MWETIGLHLCVQRLWRRHRRQTYLDERKHDISFNICQHKMYTSIKSIVFPQQLHALTMAIDIYYDAIWTHNVEAIKPLKRLAGRLVNIPFNYLFSTGIDLLNTEKWTSSDVRDPSSTSFVQDATVDKHILTSVNTTFQLTHVNIALKL